MPGTAQTDEFILSTGTIMVGPSDKLMELTPSDHSIGLVKNVNVSTDPQFVELTQGIDEQVVASKNNRNQARISAEVYEFTAKNLAYANGLNATGTDYDVNETVMGLDSDIDGVAEATTIDLKTGEGTNLVAGDFFVLQEGSNSDKVHVGKVESVTTDTVTLATGYTIPAGVTFDADLTRIYKTHQIALGGAREEVTFGVKIVGVMSATGEPITMLFPKVKVTAGLGLQLTNSDFTNMPFEFMPYTLLPGDAYYADFKGQQGKMLKR